MNMKKEMYGKPEIEIIRLKATDVLLNSPALTGEDDELSGEEP